MGLSGRNLQLALAACNSGGGAENNASIDSGNTSAGSNNSDSTSNQAEPTNNAGANAGTNTAASPDNQGSQGGAAVSARDTLTLGAIGDAATLLPNGMSRSGLFAAARMYCEPLWEYTADDVLIPVLAESVEGLESTTWTVHLRQGVTFSNGSPFTASDVFFTMQYYKDAIVGQYREFDMEKSRIIDDYTLEFILDPFGYTMQYAIGNLLIYDEETFDEDDFVINPVGTGPYVVDEYIITSHLHLKARDDYWGEKAKIANLHFKVFNEDAQLTNALLAGEIDYVSLIPAQDIAYAENALQGYNIEKYNTMQAPNLAFNLNPVSIMSNMDARLAACYATNRQAIIDLVYFGNASLIRWPVSEFSIGFEENMANLHPVYSIGMDLERAREYAEKAGIIGKDIVVITNGALNFVTTAEIFQANMKEIGVNVVINNYDAASFTTVQNDPEMYDIVMTQSASSSGLALSLIAGTMMFTPTRYEGWADFDYFIEIGYGAFANLSEAERQDVLREVAKMLIDGVVWFGICDVQAARAINKDLTGIIFMKTTSMSRFDQWYWVA